MPDVDGKSARRVAAGAGDALRRVGARVPEWAWLGALTLLATVLVASQTLQMDAWLTMTDELQYVRLALSVTQEGSPLPLIHGQASGAYSQLYPLLLSPIYGIFDTPTAFKLAHVLNALLMSSTIVPAYLLTRSVVSRRPAAYAVAALSVAVPWTALTLWLFTESAAYPAFVWTLLAMQRGLTEPSWRRDAVVLGALGIAFLARTQLAVLAFAYPPAALLHECGYSLTQSDLRSLPTALRDGIVRAATRHWLVVGVVVLAALAALIGPLVELLGPYRGTVGQSSLFPPGTVRVAGMHLALVAVGIGVIPVLLGVAWLPLATIRPPSKAAHAFVVLAVLVGLALFIQAASFVTLFALGAPNDRYFFYVVPLFLVAAAAYLVDGPRHWVSTLAATAFLAWIATLASYRLYYAYSSSPPAGFHPVLNGRIAQFAGALGLEGVTTAEGVRAIVIFMGVALAFAVRLAPQRWLAPVLAAGLLAFGVGQTRYVFHKVVPVQSTLMPRADWVDQAGGGRPVATATTSVLPGLLPDQELTSKLTWWNLEFWNRSVRSVYRYDDALHYTPFPSRPIRVAPRTGQLRGTGLPRLLVTPVRRADVEPAGHELDRNGYLKLVDLGPSPHVRWAVQGLKVAGSGIPRSGTALLRVYPRRRGERNGVRVTLELRSPASLPRAQRFRITAPGNVRTGQVRPGDSVRSRTRACVGPGAARIRIASGGTGLGPRTTSAIGLVLASLRVEPDRNACERGG